MSTTELTLAFSGFPTSLSLSLSLSHSLSLSLSLSLSPSLSPSLPPSLLFSLSLQCRQHTDVTLRYQIKIVCNIIGNSTLASQKYGSAEKSELASQDYQTLETIPPPLPPPPNLLHLRDINLKLGISERPQWQQTIKQTLAHPQ